MDLRERVLNALEDGMSKSMAHRTFQVSRLTIDHWLELRAQTGSLEPYEARHLRDSQLQGPLFEAFIARHTHATLQEMAQAWEQETGARLSVMSFSRALSRLGWTRKKGAGKTRWRAPHS